MMLQLLMTLLGILLLSVAALLWLRRGNGSLWLQLMMTNGVGVVVALAIVLFTVRAMLLSSSDLPLLVALLLIAGGISIALGMGLASMVGRRVGAVRKGASRIAAGDLAVRVQVEGTDEIAALAKEFNQMARQLAEATSERERQEAARRELVAAVSHDLRTPLASLRVLTEALADGLVDDPATTARYFGTMRSQIDLLSHLIDDLFELAQLDSGALQLDFQRVAIGDLLSDTLNGLRPQAEAKGVSLEGSVAEALPPVELAPQKIERVLYNLLANAIRHTSAGGSVQIAVSLAEAKEQAIIFQVQDNGEGIAETDLPHVFNRFYRGEKSRSRATGGAGLGLAIARGIIEAHGGKIWLESVRGAGTRVSFRLPIAHSPKDASG